MKPIKSLLLLAAFGLFASPLLQAQDQAADPSTPPAEGRRGKRGAGEGQGKQGRGGMMMNPEARVEQLDRELSLTADQKTKLTDIFAKSRTEMEALRDGNTGDREANREKLQSIMQATQQQVQGVLTDEQKTKLRAMPGRGGDRPRGGPGEKGGGQGGRRKKGE
jgi:Spy/CpxP family protein refolding chaperone